MKRQPAVIRGLLLGLPTGLILTGTVSLLWYFARPDEETPRIYAKLAEEITGEGLAAYVSNLTEVIGARHASAPGTLRRAANYLESTLGQRNMGYEVGNQEIEIGGEIFRNLWVEIPGGRRRNESVVLVAHYDAPEGTAGSNDNASGAAALLGLAETFVQEKPVLTIRLVWLVHGTPPHAGTKHSGAAHFAALLKRRGGRVRAVFCIDGIGAFPTEHPPFPETIAAYLPPRGPFLSSLADEKSIPLLKQTFDVLSKPLSLTVHQGALSTASSAGFFEAHDAAAFQAAEFPTLLIGGNAMFFPEDLPVDMAKLTEVTRSLATLVRVLTNP